MILVAVGQNSIGIALQLPQPVHQTVVYIHGNALTLIIPYMDKGLGHLLHLLFPLQSVLYAGIPVNSEGGDENKDHNNSIGNKQVCPLLPPIYLLAEVPQKAEEPVHLLGVAGNPEHQCGKLVQVLSCLQKLGKLVLGYLPVVDQNLPNIVDLGILSFYFIECLVIRDLNH